MTDKVQKIREEVERLYNQSLADENRQADRGLERAANVSYGKSKACKELLSFIDSLQEEPVSEELEEYIDKLSKQFPEVSFAKLSRIAVRVAKWQKEQMIAKAIDGYVIKDIEEGNGDFLLSADYLPKSMGLKDQQRVKVIVIKEN